MESFRIRHFFVLQILFILGFPLLSLAQTATLSGFTPLDGAANDQFGYSVSMSGNLLAVGSSGKDVGPNAGQGKAYLYNCDIYGCSLISGFTSPDGAAYDKFGWSLSLSGSLLAVGAFNKKVGSNNAQGKAYLYNCNSAGCTFVSGFNASDGAINDQFGYAVSISGNLLAVGAYYKNIGSNGAQGKVYVYNCNTAGCSFVSGFTSSDGAINDQFGGSVSISGNLLAVGAKGKLIGSNYYQGKVYLYNCNTTGCSFVSGFTASDGAASDYFGFSVSNYGNLLAVGAIGKNSFQGKVYVYNCNTAGCSFISGFAAPDPAFSDQIGASLSISGNLVVSGAYKNMVGSNSAQGKVYVYYCNTAGCSFVSGFNSTDGAAGDNFGNSVSISGNLLAIGAPIKYVGFNNQEGEVYTTGISCSLGNLCQNGGVCNAGSCSCPGGYTGTFCETVSCSNGISLSGLRCSCKSGFTGTGCDVASNGTCPLPPANPVATRTIAEFISGSVSNNLLRFSIYSPGISGRYFDVLQLSSSPNCSYPGSNFVKSFQISNCSDTFDASIPFPNIFNDCGFIRSVDVSNEYYDGVLSASVMEPVTTSGGVSYVRNIVSSLKIQLILPRSLQLNITNMMVYSLINLDVGVSRQIYNRTTDTATIEILTSVQDPYTLLNSSIISSPVDSLSTTLTNPIACTWSTTGSGQKCQQYTILTIPNVVGSNLCSLTGNYTFSWSYDCRSGTPQCATGSSGSLQASFLLQGNDLCGSLQVKSKLQGALSSYADSSFTTAKSTFLEGQKSYFQLSVTSDVTVQSITFTSIVITDNDFPANSFSLVSSSTITTLGSGSAALSIPTQTIPSSIGFSFNPTASLMNRSPGSAVSFTVSISATITYKTTFRKRDVISETFKFERSGVILPATQQDLVTSSTSSFSDAWWNIPTMMSIALALGAAYVLFRRRLVRKLICS